MIWRNFVLLGSAIAYAFTTSIAIAQVKVRRNSTLQLGTRGSLAPRSIARMPMHHTPMTGSMGRAPTHRALAHSAPGFRHFNRFQDGNFNRNNRFHRFKHFNKVIFIGNFASPWWWGPWWNRAYPYGLDGYSYPFDYSSYVSSYDNYGYNNASPAYDYGYVSPALNYYDYTNDGQSAVRDLLAEYEVSWNSHNTAAFGHLFTEDCDYVSIDGVHWKGAHEIVQRHAEFFRKKLKTAVRKLTGVEVRFSTPDVALVHATWDVAGKSRPTRTSVPVLKEITTMVVTKTNGKWLITSFQVTEGGN